MLFAKASTAEREALRLACEQDLLTFTALMFRARMAQPFLVNWHHARIVDALMAVPFMATARAKFRAAPSVRRRSCTTSCKVS